MSLKFNWEYDSRNESWVFGIESHGGGVFKDVEDNKLGWYGNSVVLGNIVLGFGPYETKKKAQEAIEADFIKRSVEL